MIELRDYQCNLLEQVQKALDPENARVMMQLPTGGGKTDIAAHLLTDYLISGRKAVWLTHRKELAEQTTKRLTRTRVIAANDSRWVVGNPAPVIADGVMILMAQTVGRRVGKRNIWSRYDANDLMVIDEAHHATAKGWELAMKCWPGRIVGMTATPWRLSKKEGFDHLFDELLCGPQVAELQAERSLCDAQVLIPGPDQRIRGGDIGSTGDYTEPGIERANIDRPAIMTAGIRDFWQKHARNRQTIIYAVSVRHARNLVNVFNRADVSAQLLLGNTPPDQRAETIAEFKRGDLQVLVNVAVATEGFDLPDASCVIIARPTESLALYFQMVGRGLRPKPDGGDCVVLDLAGNSLTHGLPETRREWTLTPRSSSIGTGDAPIVICESCDTVSPASSHNCRTCDKPLGKDCARCGKWRAWSRWSLEKVCQFSHDLVCDRCHDDAHVQNHLPTIKEIEDTMTGHINELASRVVAIRTEFQARVAGPVFCSFDSDIQAMRQLGEEVARLSALIEETETNAREILAAKDGLAKEITDKLVRSGLADLLDEPLAQVQMSFKLNKDGMELDVDHLLLNGKLLRDVFFAAYPFRTDDVLYRLEALVEETEAAKSKAVTRESANESDRRGNGEIST